MRSQVSWATYCPILRSYQRFRFPWDPPDWRFRCFENHSMQKSFPIQPCIYQSGQRLHVLSDQSKWFPHEHVFSDSMHPLYYPWEATYNHPRRKWRRCAYPQAHEEVFWPKKFVLVIITDVCRSLVSWWIETRLRLFSRGSSFPSIRWNTLSDFSKSWATQNLVHSFPARVNSGTNWLCLIAPFSAVWICLFRDGMAAFRN